MILLPSTYPFEHECCSWAKTARLSGSRFLWCNQWIWSWLKWNEAFQSFSWKGWHQNICISKTKSLILLQKGTNNFGGDNATPGCWRSIQWSPHTLADYLPKTCLLQSEHREMAFPKDLKLYKRHWHYLIRIIELFHRKMRIETLSVWLCLIGGTESNGRSHWIEFLSGSWLQLDLHAEHRRYGFQWDLRGSAATAEMGRRILDFEKIIVCHLQLQIQISSAPVSEFLVWNCMNLSAWVFSKDIQSVICRSRVDDKDIPVAWKLWYWKNGRGLLQPRTSIECWNNDCYVFWHFTHCRANLTLLNPAFGRWFSRNLRQSQAN